MENQENIDNQTEKNVKNPYRQKSLIVVPLKSKGVTITGNDMEKLGMRGSDWGQTYFDNVRVPAENLIGKPGMGFFYQMEQFLIPMHLTIQI